MCPSLNEAGEFYSLNEYVCLKERESVCERECMYVRGRERECVYVRGTEKVRKS